MTLPQLRPVEQTKVRNKSIMNRYKGLLQERKVSYSFFAYFLFQTGNFAAFSFFGVWLASQFGLQVSEVGSAMLILGLGNLTGNILGPKLVKKLGHAYSFYGGIILITILYVILPHLKQIQLVELFFFILFFITGILFVLMMSQLQHLSSSARGTGAALANSSMYIGQTIGAAVAGLLFATFHSFVAVGIFTALLYVISLMVFRKSDCMKQVEKKEITKVFS